MERPRFPRDCLACGAQNSRAREATLHSQSIAVKGTNPRTLGRSLTRRACLGSESYQRLQVWSTRSTWSLGSLSLPGHMPNVNVLTLTLTLPVDSGVACHTLVVCHLRSTNGCGPTCPTQREGICFCVGCWLSRRSVPEKRLWDSTSRSSIRQSGSGIRQLRAVFDNSTIGTAFRTLWDPSFGILVLDARPTIQGLCPVQVGSQT